MTKISVKGNKIFTTINGEVVKIGEFTKKVAIFGIKNVAFATYKNPKDIRACAEDFLRMAK